jgi:hypothetical protein
MASCNTSKQFATSTNKFLKAHNFEASVTPDYATNTTDFRASIDTLYPTNALKKIAPQADIIYKVSDGKLIVEGKANGILDADKILELYKSLISAISFWKE